MKHYEYEISLFVEDELPENKKDELMAHLSRCEKCNSLLNDFSNMKSELAHFYKVLPQNENELSIRLSEKKKINWNVRKPAFKIAFSIALLFVAIFFLLINSNMNEYKTNYHTVTSLEKTNAGKSDNFLVGDFVQHTMSYQIIRDEEIKHFNEVIDQALILKEHGLIANEILNIDANNGLNNFNEIINKSLADYYRD